MQRRSPPRLRTSFLRSQNLPHAPLEPLDQSDAKRVPERSVRNDTGALEERSGAHALRAIYDLSGEDEVPRADLLAEGTDGGEGEDGADAERLEGGDVRAGGDRGGVDRVSDAVAREEGYLCAVGQGADRDRGAWETPGLYGREKMTGW